MVLNRLWNNPSFNRKLLRLKVLKNRVKHRKSLSKTNFNLNFEKTLIWWKPGNNEKVFTYKVF